MGALFILFRKATFTSRRFVRPAKALASAQSSSSASCAEEVAASMRLARVVRLLHVILAFVHCAVVALVLVTLQLKKFNARVAMAKVVLTLLANRAVKAKRSSCRSVAFATAKA